MSEVEISVILNVHAEKPSWIRRALMSITKQVDAPPFEVIIVADKCTGDAYKFVNEETKQHGARLELVDFGDLGESRNHGFSVATGRYCCTLDADDCYGPTWLRDAYNYARALREERKEKGLDPDAFVLHQSHMVMFGASNFVHACVGDDSPEFDAKDLLQWNTWSASCFAPRETYLKQPYKRMGNGWGYEDFDFHARTYGAGVSHRVVPNTCYGVRLKGDQTSMAARYVSANLTQPRQDLYDRRDLPDAKERPKDQQTTLPIEIHRAVLWMHYELGEHLIRLEPQMSIRRYPSHTYFHEQAQIRDAIGDAKHVVLVKELVRGGAEAYAINWATVIGKDCVIIETEPGQSPWKEKAEAAGVRVIQWHPLQDTLARARGLVATDAVAQAVEDVTQRVLCDAMRRGLIQADLDSVFVCNAPIGWLLVHENAQVLGKRVFAASFAPIPIGHGFSRCPAYFLKSIPPNLTLITDNQQHADRLTNFNSDLKVQIIPPRVTYDGPSKLSRITKDRMRILWAGRGTIEKGPQFLPPLAAAVESFADIHVWGQVTPPPNTPENLRLRGAFDGFAKIDGSYDVMLMTSMYEGCPNTAMEAVLADLPVVGPNVGALGDLATFMYKKFDPLTVAMMLKESAGRPNEAAKEKVREWASKFEGSVREKVLQ